MNIFGHNFRLAIWGESHGQQIGISIDGIPAGVPLSAEDFETDLARLFNNTRVIQARLHFRKETGALIEVFCLEPLEPHEYSLSFQSTGSCSWLCLVGNLKKWKNGVLTQSVNIDGKTVNFCAERRLPHGNAHEVHFSWDDSDVTFATLLDHAGELPIPPYLNRETAESDKTTYQTVYSKIEGSVAAPTAGLHFTP